MLGWDLRTGAPKKGIEQRSEVLGTLSTEVFKMSTSEEMKEYIQELRQEETWNQLDDITKGSVIECEKELKKLEKIPEDEFKNYVILTANAESVWEDAKHNSDFASFEPYLEKIVAFNRKYVEWVGYEGNKYNALLDDYEPGLTVDIIDDVFGKLKDAIVPLVKQVTESSHQPKTEFLFHHFP